MARVWDAESGQMVGHPLRYVDYDSVVECNRDGSVVLVGLNRIRDVSLGNSLTLLHSYAQVWSTATGEQLGKTIGHDGWWLSPALSPDGKQVVTASIDGTVRVWDSQTGEQVGEPSRFSATVNGVAFSPNGRAFATACDDQTVKFWDAKSRASFGPTLRHDRPVSFVAFSPDAQRVLTHTANGLTRVWDAQSGALITAPISTDTVVTSMSLTPDNHWLWTFSERENLVRLIPLPPIIRVAPSWLPSLAESVGGIRLDSSSALVESPPIDRRSLDPISNAGASDDPGAAWLRWFLAPPEGRTVASTSEVTVPDYVRTLIGRNTRDSLSEAVALSPTNWEAFASLALTELSSSATNSDRVLADFHSMRAVQFSPDSLEVALARSRLLQRLGRVEDALGWNSNVLARFPSSIKARLLQGGLLAATNRWSEALQQFTIALEQTTSKETPPFARARALGGRRQALTELGQPEVATSEFEAAHGIPARSPSTPGSLVDLTGFYNAGLAHDWLSGSNCPSLLPQLRTGVQTLGGIPWDIRGVIQLHSSALGPESPYPSEVSHIRIGRRCRALHFLIGVRPLKMMRGGAI